jgi:hypothetical protein
MLKASNHRKKTGKKKLKIHEADGSEPHVSPRIGERRMLMLISIKKKT